MPEGHTIHRIAFDHGRIFAGQEIGLDSPQGRFEKEAGVLNGQRLTRVEAFGKHLFYRFSDQAIHIHLGLYGRFRLFDNPPPEPRGAVRLRMIGTHSSFDLNGPNCCELVSKTQAEEIIARIGVDPLRDDADPEQVWEKISGSRRTIGAALLDQSIIAGIGNIFRAEILFLCRINPERLCCELNRSEFDELWEWTETLMRIGVKENRIVTTQGRDRRVQRKRKKERLNIYKKLTCPECEEDVYYWESGNRTIYACERCQV